MRSRIIIGEISRFFSYSAKRQRLLDSSIEACDSTPKAKKLKDSCRTRWVERINSYTVFVELLPALHLCLEAMVHPELHPDFGTGWNWDGETISKANGFLFQLQSPLFLISLQILLQLLREPTIKLQSRAIDVVSAYKLLNRVVLTLESIRSRSEIEFKKQFTEATKIGKQLHGEQFQLTTPRLSGRQMHRILPRTQSTCVCTSSHM